MSFDRVSEALGAEAGVSRGRMFGSEALEHGEHVFAMEVKGALVVKLAEPRARALREAGTATAFDPGHGRPMKQWVAVAPGAADWLALAREALDLARG